MKSYTGWAEYHARVFGMGSDRESAMLAEWCELFATAGYTVAELEEATRQLALGKHPVYRADHLAAIQAAIAVARAPPPEPMPDDLGTCALCDGTGRVIVPHPKHLGKVPLVTGAVTCSCALGGWFHNSCPGQMRLADYQRSVPDWRERLAMAAQEQQARCRAGNLTSAVDAALGKLKART